MPAHKHRKASNSAPRAVPARCTTLLEDEMTRCSETPTHGNPIERCLVHYQQYRTVTQRYKEAQKFVDETLAGALIPTKEELRAYTSVPTILQKARLMKKYVNAIREERTGRDIHHKRFFLKDVVSVDDGHKIRIKLLAKQMTEGVEIRDALEARAMVLHMEHHPAQYWMEERSNYLLVHSPHREHDERKAAVNADDDLITLELRHRRELYLTLMALFVDPDRFWPEYYRCANEIQPNTEEDLKMRKIIDNPWAQYFRRMFHDPHLFEKSLNKVSIKDMVMDDDFGIEDIRTILAVQGRRMTFGLTWWKDSLIEAISIKDSTEASANMGSVENRVKILGGWIYNNKRNTPAPNKVWWTLLTAEEKVRDVEHRYVRLCCNFDELHLFVTMSAFVLEQPSFCMDLNQENPFWDASGTRKHLSLCRVIVTDMINGDDKFRKFPVPIPSLIPAKQPGCVTWVEIEMRTYIFGVIRNEPDDFTEAFLAELRAKPNLFAVVTRSDTNPPRKIECFGEVTDQVRKRQFEAPFHPIPLVGRGKWEVLRSAMDVLYGNEADISPFKIADRKGFFFHKRFPVKYILILSASPSTNVEDLARQVAWAAFRAHGLVQGDYDEWKYNKASDMLFMKHASIMRGSVFHSCRKVVMLYPIDLLSPN
ncbi:hypothetical protein B0H19DRAFT_1212808 [Mycena capillaripes]|nr:hypothetical protein B0H19DRAFT_1212808 [Mycena capillaripes]